MEIDSVYPVFISLDQREYASGFVALVTQGRRAGLGGMDRETK